MLFEKKILYLLHSGMTKLPSLFYIDLIYLIHIRAQKNIAIKIIVKQLFCRCPTNTMANLRLSVQFVHLPSIQLMTLFSLMMRQATSQKPGK